MRSSAQRILVALQVALLVAMTLTPAMALAADPSPDPSPSAEASPEVTAGLCRFEPGFDFVMIVVTIFGRWSAR